MVDVRGVTAPGDFCPVVTKAAIRVTGSGTLPEPQSSSMDELFTGRLDSQWVGMRALIRSSQKLPGKLRFSLSAGGRRFTMLVLDNPTPLAVDSEVVATGVLGTRFNARRQLIGVQLFVPSLKFVHVVRTGSPDPFRLPVTPIGQLGRYRSLGTADGRVRVTGVVTAIDPQSAVYISDGAEGLAVYTHDRSFNPGDRIEAVGFPDSLDSHRILQDALCRRISEGASLPAAALTASQVIPVGPTNAASETKYDMARVRLDAEVVQISHLMRRESFVFRFGDTLFAGELPRADPQALKSLKVGTRVRVTGLCLIKYDTFQQAESFRLLLTSAKDIQVIAQPSWFTAKHGFWLSIGLLLVLGAILTRAWMLHGEVRRQKDQILVTKAHEIALEGRYRRLVEANLAGVVTMTRDGFILDCNPAFAEMAGKDDREELVGSSFHDLCPPNNRTPYFLDLVLQRGAVSSCEVELLRTDGRTLWAIASGCVADSKDGESPLLLATLVDVTAQRQYELEIIAAKDSAEIASRMKSLFLANMSHEIRTPLNGVLGMTELALDCKLSEEVRDYLGIVHQSGNNLLNLLNDILDFSKIEAGKLTLESVEFSPRELIRTAVRTLDVKAYEKGLELIYSVDESVPAALIGDPHRLQQILLNLLGNALKFTSKGEVFVSAAAHPVEGTAGAIQLQLSVRDTGIGIQPEMRQRIFESFTQVDASNTRQYGGTGLGLAISSQLARLMGGGISVESEPSQGSTFTFRAPLSLASSDAANHCERRVLVAELCALIVDRSERNRKHIGRIMNSWGMRTHSAAGPEEACKVLIDLQENDLPLAMVVADTNALQLTNFGFAASLRGLSPRPRLLLMGAAYVEGRSALCHELGAVGYIVKPIDPADLYAGVIGSLGLMPAHSGMTMTCSTAESLGIDVAAFV